MRRHLKSGILRALAVFVLAAAMLLPSLPASAAEIQSAVVFTEYAPEIVAGVENTIWVRTNRLSWTSMNTEVWYSPDKTDDWFLITSGANEFITFTFPVDPQVTSAKIRVVSYFNPAIGFKSTDSKTLGPFDIRQPGQISGLDLKANTDGTVTLGWDDNTNMEQYYWIIRRGPDYPGGAKAWYIHGSKDHIGRLSYTDTETDRTKPNVYSYEVRPVADSIYGHHFAHYFSPAKGSILTTPPKQGSTSSIISGLIGAPDNLFRFNILDRLPPDLIKPADTDETESQGLFSHGLLVDTIYSNPIFSPGLTGLTDPEKVNRLLSEEHLVGEVTLDRQEVSLQVGQSTQLKATVLPASALNKTVSWTSNNPGVAVVDDEGKVTAKQPGPAVIRVQTEDGAHFATAQVTVEGDVSLPEPVEGEPGDEDTTPVTQFTDVPDDHWGKDDIAQAVAKSIIEGYPGGTFRPQGDVTRAEFATMLMRGLPHLTQVQPLDFRDNDEIGSWALGFVTQAVAQGIITGYPDGSFGPNRNINHAEMMAMVVRAAKLQPSPGLKTGFADDGDIPEWAKPAVALAQQHGLVFGGIEDNRFGAQANSTRAEAASSIVRLLDQ